MTFNADGDSVNIYDYVQMHTVEDNDQIVYTNDLIEITSLIDSGESFMVKGFSHVSGDDVVYIIPADAEVGLWTA